MDGYAAYNDKLHAGYSSNKVGKKMTYNPPKKSEFKKHMDL
jgi:hypothetical protein